MSVFGYLGVEIPAATALEAIAIPISKNSKKSAIGALKFSIFWVPILTTIVYFIVSLFLALDLKWDNSALAQDVNQKVNSDLNSASTPWPIEIAHVADIPQLNGAFTVLLIITAITAANTTLYVASRTLYGLTSHLPSGPNNKMIIRLFSWIGQTNKRRVPMRALVISGLCFIPLPYLSLIGENGPTKVNLFHFYLHNIVLILI
jgi:amino acid transporter